MAEEATKMDMALCKTHLLALWSPVVLYTLPLPSCGLQAEKAQVATSVTRSICGLPHTGQLDARVCTRTLF